MKKMPLVMILILILIVLIMGMADSSKYSDGKGDHHGLLSKYSSYLGEYGDPDHHLEGPDYPRDEKSFLTDNIGKSEEIAERLEDTVQNLKDSDNDVQELEDMVMDYALLVSESREYLSMAENSTSSSVEQEYLDLSREKIILANMELKDIFSKLKTYLPVPLELVEDDFLSVRGAGFVILSGDVDLDLSFSEGKFTIVDFAGDLMIDTEELSGSAIKSEHVIIPETDAMQQMISYSDVQGNVTLSGSMLTVAIMSNDVTFEAIGVGKVELYGNGTYTLTNSSMEEEGIWIPSIFNME